MLFVRLLFVRLALAKNLARKQLCCYGRLFMADCYLQPTVFPFSLRRCY